MRTDLIIIAAYLVGITLFGCSFGFRKNKSSSSDFTSGGGKIPSWAIGLSILATHVSSIAFLALPAKAYSSNWNCWVLSITVPIATVIAAAFFVPLYRTLGSVSAYAFLEKRYGPWARMYCSACFLVMQSARSGMILFLLGLLLQNVLGVSCGAVVVVTGLATLVYSLLGGISAVIWTDAIQSLILMAGAFFCIVVLGIDMPGGFSAMWSSALDAGKLSLGSFSLAPSSWADETFWVTFIYGIAINLQNFGIDQSFTQRYVAAKDMRAARLSVLAGANLYVPVTFMFVVIGTMLWGFYSGSVPPEIAARPDSVFPYFITHSLPKGVSGILIAAIVAAAMSTVSTTLNSGATVLLEDWYRRYFNPSADDRAGLRFLRLATVALAAFSLAVAFAVMGVRSALDAWWLLQSVLSGGMLGLFLLGWLSRRSTSAQAAAATTVGVLFVAWTTFGQSHTNLPVLFHKNLAIVFGTLAILLAGGILAFGRSCRRRKPANNKSHTI